MPATATALTGTIVDGRVELDAPADLPAGTRGRFVPDPHDADDLGPPSEPDDREKELAILREALEDVKAGRGRPFEQVMQEIAAEFNLPPVDTQVGTHQLRDGANDRAQPEDRTPRGAGLPRLSHLHRPPPPPR